MAGRTDIRDLILAAAEGATGGLSALRSVDPTARLEDFEVELGLADGAGSGAGGGYTAAVRFALVSRGSPEATVGGADGALELAEHVG